MRLLLFDENLSPHLVDRLIDIYPGSVHVSSVGLENEFDRGIWSGGGVSSDLINV